MSRKRIVCFDEKTRWLRPRSDWGSGFEWYDIAAKIGSLSPDELEDDYENSIYSLERYEKYSCIQTKRKFIALLVVFGIAIFMLCVFLFTSPKDYDVLEVCFYCGCVILLYTLLAFPAYRLFYRWLDFDDLFVECKLDCYCFFEDMSREDTSQNEAVYADLDGILQEYNEKKPEDTKQPSSFDWDEFLSSIEECEPLDEQSEEAPSDSIEYDSDSTSTANAQSYRDVNLVLEWILGFLSE